jgi:hypothetical protein
MTKINMIKNISFTEMLDVNKTDKIRKNKYDKKFYTTKINKIKNLV